jgi:hypothetical protein
MNRIGGTTCEVRRRVIVCLCLFVCVYPLVSSPFFHLASRVYVQEFNSLIWEQNIIILCICDENNSTEAMDRILFTWLLWHMHLVVWLPPAGYFPVFFFSYLTILFAWILTVIIFSSKGLVWNTAVVREEKASITIIPVIYGIFLCHQHKGRTCTKKHKSFYVPELQSGMYRF